MTSCKKTFSRKFNAERHNELQHGSFAIIYNKDSDWISPKRKIKPSSSLSNFSSFTSTPSTTANETRLNHNKDDNKFDFHNDSLKEFYFNEKNSEIYKENNLDESIYKIFGKISPLIDDLDKQFGKYQTRDNRIKMLSEIIIMGLSTSNPVKTLKETRDLQRSIIGFNKASEFISISKNISIIDAKLLLRSIIRTAPYSKNKFNKQQN